MKKKTPTEVLGWKLKPPPPPPPAALPPNACAACGIILAGMAPHGTTTVIEHTPARYLARVRGPNPDAFVKLCAPHAEELESHDALLFVVQLHAGHGG
jgi:hypothetical protein